MPVKIAKRGNKYRLVEKDGKIAKTKTGKAVDGGGKASKAELAKQQRAINRNTGR